MSNNNNWKNMSMTEEYFDRTAHCTEKYGPRTILLMQAGSFYEAYGYKKDMDDNVFCGSLIHEFSQICNMSISRKQSKYKNYPIFMAGFRDYSLEKYLSKLVNANFTVVVISQNDKLQEGGAKKMERFIEGVYSPGTHVAFDLQTEVQWSNHLMCIWLHSYKGQYNVGMSLLNIYTGQSYLLEHDIPTKKIGSTSFDELDKCLAIYRPKEVLFISDDESVLSHMTYLNNMNIPIHTYNTSIPFVKHATEQVYQQHILTKYFGPDASTQCAEFAYYEIATQCFCVLMHFLEEHNPNLCKHVQMPKWENKSTTVLLANHTLQQLHILENENKTHTLSSVHAWTNKCITVMGKRLFLETLTHPTFDETALADEYEKIEWTIQSGMIDPIRKQLQSIYDIQTLTRQMMSSRMYPSGLYKLYTSISASEQLLVCFEESKWMYSYTNIKCWNTLHDQIKDFLQFVNTRLYIEHCASVSQITQVETPILKRGVYLELDNLLDKYDKNQAQLNTIRTFWERQMSPNSTVVDFLKLF